MYGKPLAYIVKIKSVEPIAGADKIELAHVMDYTVVVKKNEFSAGDLALYIEVDSILPDGFTPDQKVTYEAIKDGSYFKDRATAADFNVTEETNAALERLAAASKYPYFEFLREKKFKIKSMKLSKFGVISQGILFRPSDVKITDAKLGRDYTEHFGITENVQDDEEAGVISSKKDNWFVCKLMRYKWFRDWRKQKKISETWDQTFPGKSDEENVQKLFTKMKENYGDKVWTLTEKLEGQNITVYTEEVERGLFRKKKVKRVGVCSRTRELSPNGTGKNFWATVKRLGLDEKIKNIPGEWFCRGEHVGPGIQGNIYKLSETDIVFFDFYRKEYYTDVQDRNKKKFKWVKLNFEESRLFAQKWGLKFVPVLDDNYTLPDTAQEMLELSDKNTVFGFNLKHKREGFVARLKDNYNVSFKVKNPFYTI